MLARTAAVRNFFIIDHLQMGCWDDPFWAVGRASGLNAVVIAGSSPGPEGASANAHKPSLICWKKIPEIRHFQQEIWDTWVSHISPDPDAAGPRFNRPARSGTTAIAVPSQG